MGGKDHDTRAGVKRRNRIDGQFSARPIEMLNSPAWRALSLSAHRVIDRIAIELADHGGNDNGRLPVTKLDFMEYGISDRCVAPAIREAEALGFIRVTERGRGGNSDYHQPNLFFLTFAVCRSGAPTHEWRRIKTADEAEAIAKAARGNKNPWAVALGRRRKTRTRLHKLHLVPAAQSTTGTPDFPDVESAATGSGYKVQPLSISGVGDASVYAGSNPSPRYPLAGATQPYTGYSSLPVELRMLALGLTDVA